MIVLNYFMHIIETNKSDKVFLLTCVVTISTQTSVIILCYYPPFPSYFFYTLVMRHNKSPHATNPSSALRSRSLHPSTFYPPLVLFRSFPCLPPTPLLPLHLYLESTYHNPDTLLQRSGTVPVHRSSCFCSRCSLVSSPETHQWRPRLRHIMWIYRSGLL